MVTLIHHNMTLLKFRKLLVGTIAFVSSVPLSACQPDRQTDRPPGVVICHYPQTTQIYVGSPSLCILPDGRYVASHDKFGPGTPFTRKAITKIYRSEDRGDHWQEIAQLQGQFWSNLFYHRGALYLMGTDKEHGNLIIRRSTDGGATWSTPNDEHSGLLRSGEYHTAPVPILTHNGRLWRAVENARAATDIWGKRYSAMLVSAPEASDLLESASWETTNWLGYDSTYLEGHFGGWLEGNVVVTPEGEIVDLLRVDYPPGPEVAAIVRLNAETGRLSFDPTCDFIPMPGAAKKFTVRYDSLTQRYWSLVNMVEPAYADRNPAWVRNTQALVSSPDLIHWTTHQIVLQHPDDRFHGFQYVDWLFEGEDIVFVSRTAFDDDTGGAHSNHDANYLTFHRIRNFRQHLSANLCPE